MSSIDEVRTGGKPIVTMCGSFGADVEAISQAVAELLGITWHQAPDYLAQVRRVFVGEAERQAMDRLLVMLQQNVIDARVEILTPVDRTVVSDILARNTRLTMLQAAEGGVVCGCHAAYILKDLPNAIHVRIDSPLRARAGQLALARRMTVQQAEALLDAENRLRIELAKFAHGYDPEDNGLYDLIVNLERFDHLEAARLIAAAVLQQQGRQVA